MKPLRLICILLLLASCASQESLRYDDIEYPELNDFQAPEVETFTADNGITYFLLEDRELPLIDVSVIIETGSVLDAAEKEGLASITGTVLRSGGTEQYPSDSLNVLLENRAASMETGIGFSSGSASMNVLKEDFDELLPVFINLLTNPTFPEDKVELAKTQTKSSISRRNDDTQSIAVREFRQLIYGKDTPYARNVEYETVNNITRQDLVDFHENHFVAGNMMVGVVGDFDASEMREKLENAFSNIPSGEETDLDFPEINYQPKSSINFANKSDVNQSFVLMGHLGGLRENPDYAEIQVMNRVLSGGFAGRLMQVIRTEMGLAYSAFGQYSMNTFYPGFFYAGVMTKSSTTAEAIEAVIEQIERLQNEPISQQELQDTKDQILNSAVFEYDSYEEILSQQMSYEYQGLSKDAFEQYLNEVRETTIEDVQRVAREYLNPDQLEILVVGNSDEIGDQLQQFGEVNEIDISIPEPGAGEQESVAGDAAAGREWFNKMVNAVLPNGPIDGELVFEAENIVQTPQGEMNLDLVQTTNFSTDKLVADVSMPMGQITMQIVDGEGTMMMGGNEMPMQPAQKQQLMAEYYRNHIYLALNKDDYNVEYMGMEEMEGQQLAHIRVEADQTLHLYLNPETSLPIVRTYQQFDPQAGEQVEVKVVSTDWRESDGVLIPYETISYAGGEQNSITNVSSHSVE